MDICLRLENMIYASNFYFSRAFEMCYSFNGWGLWESPPAIIRPNCAILRHRSRQINIKYVHPGHFVTILRSLGCPGKFDGVPNIYRIVTYFGFFDPKKIISPFARGPKGPMGLVLRGSGGTHQSS